MTRGSYPLALIARVEMTLKISQTKVASVVETHRRRLSSPSISRCLHFYPPSVSSVFNYQYASRQIRPSSPATRSGSCNSIAQRIQDSHSSTGSILQDDPCKILLDHESMARAGWRLYVTDPPISGTLLTRCSGCRIVGQTSTRARPRGSITRPQEDATRTGRLLVRLPIYRGRQARHREYQAEQEIRE